MKILLNCLLATALLFCSPAVIELAWADQPIKVTIDWTRTVAVSKLTPSVHKIVVPEIRPGGALRDAANQLLRGAPDYAEYRFGFGYPKVTIPELSPPKDGKTSWDFSLLDPMVLDFSRATEGHPAIVLFDAIPAWMFKDAEAVYPDDPDKQISRDPGYGKQLADPTGEQIADYYARLASWYANGGFIDELGNFHKSGHHIEITYWEVLNNPDAQYGMSVEQYTKLYDAIVAAVHKVIPKAKFVGPGGLGDLAENPEHIYEYFLNPENHRPGTPIDMLSIHYFSDPTAGPTESFDQLPYRAFRHAYDFVAMVHYIDGIRRRLSPSTSLAIDSVGTIFGMPNGQEFPKLYWNMSGGFFACLFIKMSAIGAQTLNESEVDSVSRSNFEALIDSKSKNPNACYWVLKLLKGNFAPGDIIVSSDSGMNDSIALALQARRTVNGARKILLVNTSAQAVRISLPPEADAATVSTVDENTGEGAARTAVLSGAIIDLAPFAVSVVTLS